MSSDQRVTQDLIKTLEDGKNGFEAAADHLDEDGRTDIAVRFRAFAKQRQEFSDELHALAARYGDGDDVDQTGTVAAAVHRGWMSLRDAVSGDDPDGVLDVAHQGEDHAVEEFDRALDEEISPELRSVIGRQRTEVMKTRDEVRSLAERS